jgi:hypothetical protein
MRFSSSVPLPEAKLVVSSFFHRSPIQSLAFARVRRKMAPSFRESAADRRNFGIAEFTLRGPPDLLDNLAHHFPSLWVQLGVPSPRLKIIQFLQYDMAEGVGFEPTVPLQARRFSRPVP